MGKEGEGTDQCIRSHGSSVPGPWTSANFASIRVPIPTASLAVKLP